MELTKDEWNAYRLLCAIERNTLITKDGVAKPQEFASRADISEKVNSILWNESPALKVSLAFGVPTEERKSFLSDNQPNKHDNHLKWLIAKHANIISGFIEKYHT